MHVAAREVVSQPAVGKWWARLAGFGWTGWPSMFVVALRGRYGVVPVGCRVARVARVAVAMPSSASGRKLARPVRAAV